MGALEVRGDGIVEIQAFEHHAETSGRAADMARHRDLISGRRRVPPQYGACAVRISLRGFSQQRDRDEENRGVYDVAPDDGSAAAFRHLHQAAVHLDEPVDGEVSAQPQRDQRVGWLAAHGGDVAKVGGQCLPTQVMPAYVVEIEMNALHHGVRGEHARSRRRLPGGGIVPYGKAQAIPALTHPLEEPIAVALDGCGQSLYQRELSDVSN